MAVDFDQWLASAGLAPSELTPERESMLRASFESEGRAKVPAVALPATERRLAELRAARESSIEAAAPAALPDGEIQFAADVNFEASDAKEGTPPAKSFAAHAYSGGPMRVKGYAHPIAIDLASAAVAREDVPVLLNHDEDKLVGQGTVTIGDNGIDIAGKVTGESDAANEVKTHAKNGFKWQASVGGSVGRIEHVPQGSTATVNGKTINGPAGISRGFKLKEISFVPVGADPTTSARVAAKDASMSTLNTGFQAPANEESVLAERKRISEISSLCGDNAALAAKAVDGGWSAEQTELAVLRGAREQGELRAMRFARDGRNSPRALAVAAGNVEIEGRALVASMLISSGLSEAAVGKMYPQDVMNAAVSGRLRGAGIQSAFRFVQKASGKFDDVANHRFDGDSIRAAFAADGVLQAAGFSTVSLPGLLGDYLHKMLLSSYDAQEVVWQQFCAIRPLDDFKPLHIFRMVQGGVFEEVGSTGELKHVTLIEQDYSLQAATYGALIVLSRQMTLNDDLSAFGQIAADLGRLGALKLEYSVFKLLMSNPSSFFAAGHSNYLSGGSSVLGLTALAAAERQFLLQVDDNGMPILTSPKTLLTGPTLYAEARQLLGSVELVQNAIQSASGVGFAAQSPSGNPFVRSLTPFVSPFLENENVSGNSTTAWYLAAAPTIVPPFLVGFLHGANRPTVQSGEAGFDTLGVQFRSYFDFAVSSGDWRGMLMSAGA